ncbi:MAG: hydroxylamine reductase [Candidatus Omnitrophota bacterium]
MYCRQCEQTAEGKGCTISGVCGKNPEAAKLQDLIVHGLKGIAVYGRLARELGVIDSEADRFIKECLFITITNVNFDPAKLEKVVWKTYQIKEEIKKRFLEAYRQKEGKDFTGKLPEPADWVPAGSGEELLKQAEAVGILSGTRIDEDVRSLRELLLYGMKGMAAYADHASILGYEDEEVNAFFYKGLAGLADDTLSAEGLISLNMELGKVNLKCMDLLDKAHTTRFGHPVPTEVLLGVKKGPAIIVSGHDLLDLEHLLEQAQGKGVNVYTHGEMLPAHSYPGLKKYVNLVGHYGTAWQNQQKEFNELPGAILMTTNCLQRPQKSYQDRMFTTGLVGWPGIEHVASRNEKKDFSRVIEKALSLSGFPEDKEEKRILVGFGHNTVLGLADKVVSAVKSGAVRHFFLIGGCDGAKPGRNYYTQFAEKVPSDCVILTLACGKFRFNRLDFGMIGDIPRLLDCGQCNDAYSAITIAVGLAKAFGCEVNELPLSLILSWYEQKAVVILITLLSLGIKNIRLGPSLPAFVSPNVLKVLAENFGIKPISIPEKDLAEILNKS